MKLSQKDYKELSFQLTRLVGSCFRWDHGRNDVRENAVVRKTVERLLRLSQEDFVKEAVEIAEKIVELEKKCKV